MLTNTASLEWRLKVDDMPDDIDHVAMFAIEKYGLELGQGRG